MDVYSVVLYETKTTKLRRIGWAQIQQQATITMVTDGVHQLSIRLVGGGPYGVRLSGGGMEPLTVSKVRNSASVI